MTIIFVNRYFYPDHSATSQMLSDLAFALAHAGEPICVITSRLRYDDPEAVLTAAESINGVRIERVRTSRFGRHNLLGRALDYATFYISAAWRLFRLARKGDIVVSKTDPPMLGVVMGPVARLCGAKPINWLQDIFPEVAENLGMGGARARSGFALLKAVRSYSLRKSVLTVAIGRRMAERLETFDVARDKIRVIPNWADCTAVVPVKPDDNPLRGKWGLNEAFVVGYSGNLGRAHEIETFLDAIAELEQAPAKHPVRWLFIGGGAQLDPMRQEAARRSLTSVSFHPYQPREQLSQSLSAADVHLVSLRPELEGLIVPSKFYGIAAAGRPSIFIGDGSGEIAGLLREHDCGVTVAQGDGKALADAILWFAANPQRARAMGERARSAALVHFSLSVALRDWLKLLSELRTPR